MLVNKVMLAKDQLCLIILLYNLNNVIYYYTEYQEVW